MVVINDKSNNSTSERISTIYLKPAKTPLYFTPVAGVTKPNEKSDISITYPFVDLSVVSVKINTKYMPTLENGSKLSEYGKLFKIGKDENPYPENETPYEFVVHFAKENKYDFFVTAKEEGSLYMFCYVLDESYNADSVKDAKREDMKPAIINFKKNMLEPYANSIESAKALVNDYHPSSSLFTITHNGGKGRESAYPISLTKRNKQWDYLGDDKFEIPEDFDWNKELFGATYDSQIVYFQKIGLIEFIKANSIAHTLNLSVLDKMEKVDSPL